MLLTSDFTFLLCAGFLSRFLIPLAQIEERGLDLKVAFITGDDLLPELGPNVASLKKHLPKHLDSLNPSITLPPNTEAFLENDSLPLVSANAYLGARAIVQGLRLGADIIVAGRVSDASPVIGAAWYWHSWSETNYDRLAGALIAGHLIECSAYVTGGNFSGFTEYDLDLFIEPGFPIAEVAADGSCVITKHENTGGLVNEDTVKCQFLYELQGNIYLHSDLTAYLDGVEIKSVGKDRYISITLQTEHLLYLPPHVPESKSLALSGSRHHRPPKQQSSTEAATSPKSSSTQQATARTRNGSS